MTDKAYSEIRKKMGEAFAKHRKARKLSYRKLEAMTGVDHSWISKFEKGKLNFEIDTLIRLLSGVKIQIKDVTDFNHRFVDE